MQAASEAWLDTMSVTGMVVEQPINVSWAAALENREAATRRAAKSMVRGRVAGEVGKAVSRREMYWRPGQVSKLSESKAKTVAV
jgi:hypothetical protein